ncbi:MAG: malate dehydrogenase [Armatimonadetes bacterium]|nr:malate dehydrogenase [Armatimonadota bacterium]
MKVSIVGAGNVGATAAQRMYALELAREVVLVDVVPGLAYGKALDMQQAAPLIESDCRITGATNYDATAGSDIVVITAGLARKAGMSRDDLLARNAETVRDVARQIVARSPNAILITVSNPVDEMTWVALRASGLDRRRVIGMSGVLDSTRLRSFIAQELHAGVEDVDALVVGSHGDAMVPLVRYASVAGIPVAHLLPPERIAAIVERTRNAGSEIIDLLKTSSAYYAPAAAITAMVESIIRDKRRILPCATLLQGEYGLRDVVLGVPAKLGRDGIEEIVQIDLLEEERVALKRSAQVVRDNIARLPE